MKGLENLRKYSHRKHAIIACAARQVNDQYMGDLLQFCHDNRDLISDIGIIPLTENWNPGEFDVGVHTTMEDVETMVQRAVPGGRVEFVPAGLSYCLRKARSFFQRDVPSEVLLFAGAHPNCESMTLLVSDGRTYRSINHYLRRPLSQVALEVVALTQQIEPQLDHLDPSRFLQRVRGQFLVIRTLGGWGLRTVRFWRLKPIRRLGSAVFWQFYRKAARLAGVRTRRARDLVHVAVLPIEEEHSIDAARLQRCKAAFAYEDTEDGKIKYIPACLWYPYRNPILEKLSKKYGVVGNWTRTATPAAV